MKWLRSKLGWQISVRKVGRCATCNHFWSSHRMGFFECQVKDCGCQKFKGK